MSKTGQKGMKIILTALFCVKFSVQRKAQIRFDSPCGLVVKVPSYRTEMYCVSCEVRAEFIYVM
jgi:hypothetical protein